MGQDLPPTVGRRHRTALERSRERFQICCKLSNDGLRDHSIEYLPKEEPIGFAEITRVGYVSAVNTAGMQANRALYGNS